MRSIDRYRKFHKESVQSAKKKRDKTIEDWDFNTTGHIPPKKFPISLQETEFETDIQRFERFVRQLGRCIISCSLCKRGLKEIKCGNELLDPHCQPSIWYKNVILIKQEPDCSDKAGLFESLRDVITDCGLNFDNFYKTTIIKCVGDDYSECPYFELEWKAISECNIKLIICFDAMSVERVGGNSNVIDELQRINDILIFYAQSNKKLVALFKLLSNQQTRNLLS